MKDEYSYGDKVLFTYPEGAPEREGFIVRERTGTYYQVSETPVELVPENLIRPLPAGSEIRKGMTVLYRNNPELGPRRVLSVFMDAAGSHAELCTGYKAKCSDLVPFTAEPANRDVIFAQGVAAVTGDKELASLAQRVQEALKPEPARPEEAFSPVDEAEAKDVIAAVKGYVEKPEHWELTPQLRWRQDYTAMSYITVLQQKSVNRVTGEVRWADVPTEGSEG